MTKDRKHNDRGVKTQSMQTAHYTFYSSLGRASAAY